VCRDIRNKRVNTPVLMLTARDALDEAGVIAALGKRLAKYKIPKRVITVPELPRNTMGKVQKNLLREQYKTLYVS